MSELKVGDPIWYFNQNRRHYTKPTNGGYGGEIIWRDHWEKMTVLGETRISFLVGSGPYHQIKVNKKNLASGELRHSWATSEAEIDDMVWMHYNRYGLSQKVYGVSDISVLRKIAELADYKEKVNG